MLLYLQLFFVFIIGLCFGSFAAAMIYRRRAGLPLNERQRSFCPKCNNQLKIQDLVPLFSWLFLKGKCRYCAAPVSVFYPLVELAFGTLFFAFYAGFSFASL